MQVVSPYVAFRPRPMQTSLPRRGAYPQAAVPAFGAFNIATPEKRSWVGLFGACCYILGTVIWGLRAMWDTQTLPPEVLLYGVGSSAFLWDMTRRGTSRSM